MSPEDGFGLALGALGVIAVGAHGARRGFRNLPIVELIYFWAGVILIAVIVGGG